MEVEAYLSREGIPQDRSPELVDVGDLPPPQPLTETLERLAELDDDRVLVQTNDRVPQHLYPKLNERGYEYETFEDTDDGVVTVIWRED